MNTVIVKESRMTRKAALELAGDMVDSLYIRLSRIDALTSVIMRGAEDGVDAGQVVVLADMASDEARTARQELEEWFDGLTEVTK